MVCILSTLASHDCSSPANLLELKIKITEAKDYDNLLSCRAEISCLNKDAALLDRLPSYEKRQVNEILDDLYKLADCFMNRLLVKKFSFIGDPIPSRDYKHFSPSNAASKFKDTPTSNHYLPAYGTDTLAHLHSEKKYFLPSLPHLLINDVADSIVVQNSSTTSVHLTGVTSSKIYLYCDGPILVTNVRDSILVLACHQLRLHGVSESRIFPHVASGQATLEGCSALYFGPYPTDQGANPRKLLVSDFSLPNLSLPSQESSSWSGQNYQFIDEISPVFWLR